MKTIIAAVIAAVLLAPTDVSAQQLRIRSTYYRGIHTTDIYRVQPGAGLGQAIDVPETTDPARDARIAEWEKFCQPKITVDKLGVGRYGYAHSGCDTGRSQ